MSPPLFMGGMICPYCSSRIGIVKSVIAMNRKEAPSGDPFVYAHALCWMNRSLRLVSMSSLPMFVIYRAPKDRDSMYCARMFLTLPEELITNQLLDADSLEGLRELFDAMNFIKMNRHASDDPCIIETWMI